MMCTRQQVTDTSFIPANRCEAFVALLSETRQLYCASFPTQLPCFNSCERTICYQLKCCATKTMTDSTQRPFFLFFFFMFLFSLPFLFVLQLYRCRAGSSLLSTTCSAERRKGPCISPLTSVVFNAPHKRWIK